MKIKKGDIVKVIAGKFKGTVARVVLAKPKENKVVIEGVNVKKRSVKKTDSSDSDNFVYLEHPIHSSNVRLATEDEVVSLNVLDSKKNKEEEISRKKSVEEKDS